MGRMGLGRAAGPLEIPHPHMRRPVEKEALPVLFLFTQGKKKKKRKVILSESIDRMARRGFSSPQHPAGLRTPQTSRLWTNLLREYQGIQFFVQRHESKQPPDSKSVPRQQTHPGNDVWARGHESPCLRCSARSCPFCPQCPPPPPPNRGPGSCSPRPVKQTRVLQTKSLRCI